MTDALGHTVGYDSYDANGRLTQITDASGLVTTYVYDLRGRLYDVIETPPTGQGVARTTSYRYDDAGQLKTFTSAAGQVITYTYDIAHYLRSVSDSQGNRIEYRYDVKGNRSGEQHKDPDGVLQKDLQLSYDLRNRLQTINNAGDITQLINDAVGNLLSETDPNDLTTTYHYDPLDRLESVLDTMNQTVTYQHDTQDRLAQVTAANQANTVTIYDDLGNRLQESSPDRGTLDYLHDDAGNLISQTDGRGVIVTYQYDALNRLTLIDYPDNALDTVYVYDENLAGENGLGRLTTVHDGSGDSHWRYDVFGNVIAHTTLRGGLEHTTGYAYNAADQLIRITYPSQRTVDYPRDADGLIRTITSTLDGQTQTLASGLDYRPFGPLTTRTFGNGLVEDRDYDLAYRLSRQTLAGKLDRGYHYEPAGNVDTVDDLLNATPSQQYGYDDLYRLQQADGVTGLRQYTYDANGNRKLKQQPGLVENYQIEIDSNRLQQIDGGTPASRPYQYDGNGNTLDDGHYHYRYGDHNRLTEVLDTNDISIASYRYNAFGQRVQKTTGGVTTYYHYDLNGQLLAETNATGQALREYVFAHGRPLAFFEPEGYRLQVPGSPETLTIYDQEKRFIYDDGQGVVLEQNNINLNQTESELYVSLGGQTQPSPENTVDYNVWFSIQNNTLQHVGTGNPLTDPPNYISLAFLNYFLKPHPLTPVSERVYTSLNATATNYLSVDMPSRTITFGVDSEINNTYAFSGYSGTHDVAVGSESVWTEIANGDQLVTDIYSHLNPYEDAWFHGVRLYGSIEEQNTANGTVLTQGTVNVEETYITFRQYEEYNLDVQRLSKTYYFHNDHLGTPQLITDNDQNTVWQADYTPFGQAQVTLNTVANPLRFPGQYFDQETGLHYNWHRYYDPETGRYVTSDPIGLGGGLNTYGYVAGNPVNLVDPTGLLSRSEARRNWNERYGARVPALSRPFNFDQGAADYLNSLYGNLDLNPHPEGSCESKIRDVSIVLANLMIAGTATDVASETLDAIRGDTNAKNNLDELYHLIKNKAWERSEYLAGTYTAHALHAMMLLRIPGIKGRSVPTKIAVTGVAPMSYASYVRITNMIENKLGSKIRSVTCGCE